LLLFSRRFDKLIGRNQGRLRPLGAMRDFIIVTILCIAAAIAVDHFWFGGKYFGAVDLGFSASSVQRRPAN
jgi:hypothetical protein